MTVLWIGGMRWANGPVQWEHLSNRRAFDLWFGRTYSGYRPALSLIWKYRRYGQEYGMSDNSAEQASLTVVLEAWHNGDGAAFAQVFDQTYGQLKKIAAQRLREVAGD